MLLNKRKVSVVTKVGAVIVALAFVVGLISFSMGSSDVSNNGAPQQQVQEKIASLEQAALKNPKSADAWIVLGNAYQDANFYDRAVASYQKALAIDPKRTNVRVDMAISCYGLGQLETATAEAKKAIETDPKFAPAYYNLGVFLVSQGKNQEALNAYEQYMKLDPNGERINDARQQIDTLSKAVNAGVSGEPVVGTGGSDSASSTGGK